MIAKDSVKETKDKRNKRNKGKNTYIPRLYNEIAPLVMEKINLSYVGDSEEELRNKRRHRHIHNRLNDLWNLLEGKVTGNKKTKYPVKGMDIFPSLNLEKISNEKLAEFFVMYIEYIDSGEGNDHKNRQMKSNILKNDIDYNFEFLIMLMKKADDKTDEKMVREIEESYNTTRYILVENMNKKSYEYMNKSIKTTKRINVIKLYFKNYNIFKTTLSESIDEMRHKQFEKQHYVSLFEDYNVAWLYVDLIRWFVLQSAITFIIRNKLIKNKFDCIDYLNEKLLEEILKRKDSINEKIDIKSSEEFKMIASFFMYIKNRDKLLQNIEIYKFLEDKCKDRKNTEEKYKVEQFQIFKNIEERKYYYMEDDVKGETRFEYNYNLCETYIKLFESKTNRKLSIDERCKKAFFREIILDTTEFNRKQAKTIFRDFANNNCTFGQKKDHYFINEKINLGVCREEGNLDLFWKKNELQEDLHYLMTLILCNLNPLDIYNDAKKVLRSLLYIIPEILEKKAEYI